MALLKVNCTIRTLLVLVFAINVSMILVFRLYVLQIRQESIGNRKFQLSYYTTVETDTETHTFTMAKENTMSSTARINGTEMINVNFTTELNVPAISNCIEYLGGSISVNYKSALQTFHNFSNITQADITTYGELFLGNKEEGYKYKNSNNAVIFEPKNPNCQTAQNVAFIIPFRNRETHLRLVVGHLIPVLQRQNIRFAFFIVTQNGNEYFNKGRLMNTGFEFASEVGKARNQAFDCYIFHDVDLFVEHDSLLYRCGGGKEIDHLAPRIDKFKYVPYCCGMTVGGVIGFTEEQYRTVNGYSNKYWGWGAEDDDMADRLELHDLGIRRPEGDLGKYTMMSHQRDSLNPINTGRFKILWDKNKKFWNDGLGNLDTKITSVLRYPLFVNVLVDVGKPPT
uniref:beta-1,4-galactosyltransferase 4-like isoform X1 n=1 Tax=Styela clava TaxID=7725 RepID=UPI0019396C64|nr:beta-1,4-galactosyltransferase 4-like isoform X1 [Styela clava]